MVALSWEDVQAQIIRSVVCWIKFMYRSVFAGIVRRKKGRCKQEDWTSETSIRRRGYNKIIKLKQSAKTVHDQNILSLSSHEYMILLYSRNLAGTYPKSVYEHYICPMIYNFTHNSTLSHLRLYFYLYENITEDFLRSARSIHLVPKYEWLFWYLITLSLVVWWVASCPYCSPCSRQ
jgi:hypothetical protein